MSVNLNESSRANFFEGRRLRLLFRKLYRASSYYSHAIYIAKIVLAALMALCLSLAFNLGSPRTAVFCVFLVMQTQTGLVFQKSYFRLLGTLAGATVAVILMGAFAQTPEMFFFFFAIWIAICTAGSFIYRNFQSYGFVLAGFTVCFVALPITGSPENVFDVAVNRALEMFVGVLCAAFVSDILFPQRMADVIGQKLLTRFKEFSEYIRLSPMLIKNGGSNKEALLRFSGDALGFEAAHVNANFETSNLRRYSMLLKMLNHDFMSLATSLHALNQLLRRIHTQGNNLVFSRLITLYDEFSLAITPSFMGKNDIEAVLVQLQEWLRKEPFPMGSASVLMDQSRELSRGDALDLETGYELLESVAQDFEAYCALQLKLIKAKEVSSLQEQDDVGLDYLDMDQKSLRFSTRTDPALVLVAVARGVAVLTTLAAFWVATGWTLGYEPILNGVAAGTLFASLPSPVAFIKHVLIGWLIALPIWLLWNFLFIPLASDWIGLSLILIPPLALMAYLANSPKWAAIGAGLYISFILHTSLEQSFVIDFPTQLELFIADFIGFATAGIFYILIDPNMGGWGRRRIVANLRLQIADICTKNSKLSRERLESSSRDLIQKIASQGRLANESDAWVFDWMLSVLEIGRATIDLKVFFQSEGAHQSESFLNIFHGLKSLFEKPSNASYKDAFSAVEFAIDEISSGNLKIQTHLESFSKRELLSRLHLLRSALQNPILLSHGGSI